MQKKRYLGAKEVADMIGFSVKTVTTWAAQYIESGGAEGIPAFRLGKRRYSFVEEEVECWIEQKEQPAKADRQNRAGKVAIGA